MLNVLPSRYRSQTPYVVAVVACALIAATLFVGDKWGAARWGLAGAACLCIVVGIASGIANQQTIVSEFTRDIRRALEALRNREDLTESQLDNSPLEAVRCEIVESLGSASRDISDLEHSRSASDLRMRRITAERDRLREVVDAIPFPVAEIDSSENLVLANTTAREVLAIDESRIGKPCRDVVAQPSLANLLLEMRKRTPGTTKSIDLATGTGENLREWKAYAKTISYGQGPTGSDGKSPTAAVIGMTDNSALKTIQKRNAEFVSAASHEMKAPLTSIRAYAELLSDEPENEAARDEYIRVILSQTDRLHRLVLNLLNIARIEAGVVNVNKAELSLNDVLRGAFESTKPSATAKQITLVEELSPMYLAIYADKDTLVQAAINLLSNAVKYTPDNGKVVLRSRLDEGTVSFEVTDTGMGLSPEDRVKVFERFYRVAQNREMAPGTGLGLPLVKHIVEDVHGGRIEVESELGKGSTFRVVLPRVSRG
jgi:two-component system phosphate regulon sensor histidine kinase PhoR